MRQECNQLSQLVETSANCALSREIRKISKDIKYDMIEML